MTKTRVLVVDDAIFMRNMLKDIFNDDHFEIVGEAANGVEAGQRGGFGLVVGVDRTGHAEALKEHGADVVVQDLSEVEVEARTGVAWVARAGRRLVHVLAPEPLLARLSLLFGSLDRSSVQGVTV